MGAKLESRIDYKKTQIGFVYPQVVKGGEMKQGFHRKKKKRKSHGGELRKMRWT